MNDSYGITITIDRLRIYAYHGVNAQERTVGNWFEVSASLRYPAAEAVATDNLGATLDYAEALDVIVGQMKKPSKLLEHAAGRIRDALMQRWPEIKRGKISVAKLNPPVNHQVASLGVELSW